MLILLSAVPSSPPMRKQHTIFNKQHYLVHVTLIGTNIAIMKQSDAKKILGYTDACSQTVFALPTCDAIYLFNCVHMYNAYHE